MGKKSLMRKGS